MSNTDNNNEQPPKQVRSRTFRCGKCGGKNLQTTCYVCQSEENRRIIKDYQKDIQEPKTP